MPDPIDDGGPISQRYERLGILGRGGQGIVYRAFDRWLKRPVAIKVLSSKLARKPEMAQRLVRELQALSTLKGTAAVEVFDIFRGKDGELCLVMELLVGTDLDEHLYRLEQRNESMPLARIAELFDPIVDTLDIAHNAGILHRDLKPANVFLLDAGGVRLLDFGMARLRKGAPLTAAGTVMGSPSFMAPEAWSGRSELVDHRADVYSLGVILFRIVAGELPFTGQSLQEKFLGTTKAARPSLVAKRPDLPRRADDWVTLALAIDRDERFRNVRALWSAFLTTFDIEPPAKAKRPSFWAAAKDTVRRIAGGGEALPVSEHQIRSEPSFMSEALARSIMSVEDSDATLEVPAATLAGAGSGTGQERTIELSASDLGEVSQFAQPLEVTVNIGPRAEGGAERPVERTLELSESDLAPTETDAGGLSRAASPAGPLREPPPPPRRGERS